MLTIREDGEGEPLVLVHGAGTSSAIWHRVTPLLADGRRVVAGAQPPKARAAAATISS